MNAPTPEQFLALPSDPEEDEAEHVDPLGSIAESLRTLAAALTAGAPKAEDACEAHAKALHACQEDRDQLMRVNSEQAEQLQQVLAICKPSVGKLANRIREALQPAQEPQQEPAAEPESEAVSEEPPADDAPVEEWRAYAHGLGYTGHGDIDKMNRSQIRTMLGVRQPVAEG